MITLGIIGVVAALVMPGLIAAYKQKTYDEPKKVLVTDRTHKPTQLVRYYLLPNLVENNGTLVIDENLSQDDLCETINSNDYMLVNYLYSDTQMARLNYCLTEKVEELARYESYKIEHIDAKSRLIRVVE